MKRGIERLCFEENQTGEALLSELEHAANPVSTLGKIHSLCCDNASLFANELLGSNRERFLKDLKQIALGDTEKLRKLKQDEWAKCMRLTKDIVLGISAYGEASGIPGDVALDLGDFVRFIFDRTPKTAPEGMDEITSLLASTLFAFNMKRHKLKFGETLTEYLLEKVNAGRDNERELQIIRYITTDCPENVRRFIELKGEKTVFDVLCEEGSSKKACSFACGIIANVCSVDSSLLVQTSDILFAVCDFVRDCWSDASLCCMGVSAIFALVGDSTENLTILYWLGWMYKLRYIKRYYNSDVLISSLCEAIMTMFEQLSKFWNIHTEHGDISEIVKSIFVVLRNSPSKNLAKYGLIILRNILIDNKQILIYVLRVMAQNKAFSIFRKLVDYEECDGYVEDIIKLTSTEDDLCNYLSSLYEDYRFLVDFFGIKKEK